jgi:hypothetical protein
MSLDLCLIRIPRITWQGRLPFPESGSIPYYTESSSRRANRIQANVGASIARQGAEGSLVHRSELPAGSCRTLPHGFTGGRSCHESPRAARPGLCAAGAPTHATRRTSLFKPWSCATRQTTGTAIAEVGGSRLESPCALGSPCRVLSHPTPWCSLAAPLHGAPGCATRQTPDQPVHRAAPM